jgi:coenzyme PQQ precursor peptide PqqA
MHRLGPIRTLGDVQDKGIARDLSTHSYLPCKETAMKWTKPEFSDLRFGFEITMYIASR